jgi:hypothetical protein
VGIQERDNLDFSGITVRKIIKHIDVREKRTLLSMKTNLFVVIDKIAMRQMDKLF